MFPANFYTSKIFVQAIIYLYTNINSKSGLLSETQIHPEFTLILSSIDIVNIKIQPTYK